MCIRASWSRPLLEVRAGLVRFTVSVQTTTTHRCGCHWDCCKAQAACSVELQEDAEGAVCCVSKLVAHSCEVVGDFVASASP